MRIFIILSLLILGSMHAQAIQPIDASTCQIVQPLWKFPKHFHVPSHESEAADFRSQVSSLVSKLLAKGYDRFGDLDLHRFSNDLNQVSITFVPALKFNQDDGHERAGACWSFVGGRRSVAVSEFMWAYANPQIRQVLALHEFLGAFGFDDQNYQLSTTISILATATSPLVQAEFFPALTNVVRSPTQSARVQPESLALAGGGGIAGVGGGGDWAAAELKLAFYQAGLEEISQAQSTDQVRQAIINLNDLANAQVEATWR